MPDGVALSVFGAGGCCLRVDESSTAHGQVPGLGGA